MLSVLTTKKGICFGFCLFLSIPSLLNVLGCQFGAEMLYRVQQILSARLCCLTENVTVEV